VLGVRVFGVRCSGVFIRAMVIRGVRYLGIRWKTNPEKQKAQAGWAAPYLMLYNHYITLGGVKAT
jgi:hypothetical protein